MKKEFSMSNDKVIINFTAKYCSTFEGVLESEGFRRVLDSYLRRIQNKRTLSYRYLSKALNSEDVLVLRRDLMRAFKFLTVMNVEEIVEFNEKYTELLTQKKS